MAFIEMDPNRGWRQFPMWAKIVSVPILLAIAVLVVWTLLTLATV